MDLGWLLYIVVAILTFITCSISDWIEYEEILVGDIVTNLLIASIPLINLFVMANHILDWIEIQLIQLANSKGYDRFKTSWLKFLHKQILKKKV